MNRSDNIADLVEALAKAQGAIEDAQKDATMVVGKDKGSGATALRTYADLASVRAAIRHPLSENGLSYVQAPRTNDGSVTVETFLFHSSGQFLSESLTLPVEYNSPKAYGSAITYARRYSLMAILGVAPADDDDADAATWKPDPEKVQPEPRSSHPPPPPAPSPKAVHMAREIRQCQTADDVDYLKRTEEFIFAWKGMNEADRIHIGETVAQHKAKLENRPQVEISSGSGEASQT